MLICPGPPPPTLGPKIVILWGPCCENLPPPPPYVSKTPILGTVLHLHTVLTAGLVVYNVGLELKDVGPLTWFAIHVIDCCYQQHCRYITS